LSVIELLDSLFYDREQHSLILCLGNSLRSDDGVGPYLASCLRGHARTAVEDLATRPERCLDLVTDYRPDQVVFVDAADFGAPPGTLQLIDRLQLDEHTLSSHRLPLAPLCEWIEREHGIPCHCLGIQPASLQLGEKLSPAVAAIAKQILDWFHTRLDSPNPQDPA
jgi:hydrogenase 3 maturation protease